MKKSSSVRSWRGERGGAQIAQSDSQCPERPQFPQRAQAQFHGVVEKLPHEINARQARTNQHYIVGRVAGRIRIGTAVAGGEGPRLVVIHQPDVVAPGAFDRKNAQPPVHHAIRFRKKPVPADVHAIALVIHGAGQPAQRLAFFEHHGVNAGAGAQFQGGRETGRPGANDDCSFARQSFSRL